MAGKKQTRTPSRPTTAADAMPAEDRRADPRPTRPEDLPEVEGGRLVDEPVGGGTTPAIDGGNDQHPIHDEDQEDRMPSDYEREIDRLDAATRSGR